MTARVSARLRLTVSIVGLVFLHFLLRPLLEGWYLSPNLLICAVLVPARQLRAGAAAVLGFVLGLLEDAMAVSQFGLASLLLVLLGYAGARTRDFFLGEERLFMGTYLLVATWLFEVITYIALGTREGILAYLLVRAPLDGLATAVVGYLVGPVMRPR